MNTSYITQHYNALLDSPTNVVLTIGKSVSAIIFLSECVPDTRLEFSINYPKYTESFLGRYFWKSLRPEDYPKWTWDRKARIFVKTGKEVLNEQITNKSRLAESKHDVISKIMLSINIARYKVRTGLEFQETVYLTKKLQAQKFKDSGYNEDTIMQCPYVLQYADYANISLQQSALDILLKSKLDDDLLAKTELLRLKYFSKIKEATAPEQLPQIYAEFKRDCYINAQI